MSEAIPANLMSQPGMQEAIDAAKNEVPPEPNWDEELYWAQQAENRVAQQQGREAREISMEEVKSGRHRPVASVPVPQAAPEPQSPGTGTLASVAGSLEDRMRQARTVLDAQQTTKLDVPGYEGVLKVECRTLDWTTLRRIAIRNENEPDQVTRELYSAAGEILSATMGFYEVLEDGTDRRVDHTWLSLAQRIGRATNESTPRQALFGLLREIDLMLLSDSWRVWNVTARQKVEEDLKRDFEKTR